MYCCCVRGDDWRGFWDGFWGQFSDLHSRETPPVVAAAVKPAAATAAPPSHAAAKSGAASEAAGAAVAAAKAVVAAAQVHARVAAVARVQTMRAPHPTGAARDPPRTVFHAVKQASTRCRFCKLCSGG